MAITEQNGLMIFKDAEGNKVILYPVTKKELVDGMEDVDAHLLNKDNPHGITTEKIGAIPLPDGGTAGQVLTKTETGVAWQDATGGGSGLVIDSIYIATKPTKTSYLQGEAFDPSGMVVKGKYAIDGVVITESEITGYTYPTGGLADGTTSVTITYSEGGVTCTAEVAVTVTHKLTGISVAGGPTTTSYQYGDTLSTSGLSIKATYSDGATATVTGWSCSPTALSTVGTQAITVTYTENGVTKTTTFNVTVERKRLSAVPSQSGTLTYSGSAQSPSWSNYNSSQLTLGGVTSGTAAGSYTATFTPKDNYAWSDGSTDPKSVAWTIGKAAGSLTLSKNSVEVTADAKTTTFTVTRAGDGAISVKSSNTGIATVSLSGTTVTVTGVATGTATITVSVAEGTNHKAPTDATCAVTVAFKPKASTTKTSGVSYTSGISGVTQAKLNEYAEAISNNSAITNATSTVYIDDGSSHYEISVGDKVSISVSGASYDFVILGFNHDDLTTATAYGTATATGKAGITFQMEHCLATTYNMNSSNTNSGGWGSSAMRSTHLASTIKGTIAAAWTGIMKKVNKKTSAGSQSTTINTTSDDLFLLAEIEVFGSTTYSVAGEGSQYAWYKAGNTKIKNVNGSAYYWWERSPHASNSASFCLVGSNGNAYSYTASNSWGVAFGFCV